jgi:hypothetical protein
MKMENGILYLVIISKKKSYDINKQMYIYIIYMARFQPNYTNGTGQNVNDVAIYDSNIQEMISQIFPHETLISYTDGTQRGSYNIVDRFQLTHTETNVTRTLVLRRSVNTISTLVHHVGTTYIYYPTTNGKPPVLIDLNIMDPIDSQVLKVFKTNLAVSDAGERKNWFNASELDISPPLHFYGFRLTRHHHAGTTKYYNLQKIIISDAYDSSLSEYYKKKRESHVLSPSPTLTLSHHSASSSSSPGSSSASPSIGLDTNDLNIAAQIWAILNKVHKNALTIPFDIKPGNMVVKEEEDETVTVRMIDLDAAEYSDVYKDKHKKRDLSGMFVKLSIIIIANHFFYYLNINIFQGQYDETERAALRELFCEMEVDPNMVGMTRASRSNVRDKSTRGRSKVRDKSDIQRDESSRSRSRHKDTDTPTYTPISIEYQHFSNHYFSKFIGVNHTCAELFNIMFDNMKYLNPNDKSTKKGAASTASTASAASTTTQITQCDNNNNANNNNNVNNNNIIVDNNGNINEKACSIMGGKSKKKKRISKKTKKKRRKTKRKRT